MSVGITAGVTAAIIAGTAAAGSAAIGAHAIGSAADKQKSAADQSLELEREQMARQQPWVDAGGAALGKLSSLPAFAAPSEADAASTPGYQFALNQGLQGVSRNAAATGMTGGAAAKMSARYATGLADSTYNDVYNRALETYGTNRGTLLSLAGLGQNANAADASTTNQSADILQGSANAQGAAGLAQGNLLSGLGLQLSQLGTGANLYQSGNTSSYGNQFSKGPAPGTVSPGQWSDYDAGRV